MKKQRTLLLSILGALLFSFTYGQSSPLEIKRDSIVNDSIVVGHKGADLQYREDQFYIGFTLNFLGDKSPGFHQAGFSGGLHLGFIRDFPLNEERNIGLGVGLGWSMNTFGQNLLISEQESGQSLFQILDQDNYDYKVNRFSTYLVEMPIQFRWRTSTADTYRFWRIYAGVKLGYLYYFKSKFEQPQKSIVQTQVEELNRFRYGASFVFGYSSVNFMVYYSLNSLFDAHTVNGQPVGLSVIKVGLLFYIL